MIIKTLLTLSIWSICLTSTIAQSAMALAEASACACLEAKFDKAKSYTENEKIVEQCLLKAFSNHYAAFEQEYTATQLSDESFGYQLGEQLGVKLAASCPTFMEFSLLMAKQSLDTATGDAEMLVGTVVEIQNTPYCQIVLEVASGERLTLTWLKPFAGAKAIGHPETLLQKQVQVTFEIMELFDAQRQAFRLHKVISSLETL